MSVNAARATRDADHISRLFSHRAERLGAEYDAGFGIDMIRLAVSSVSPLDCDADQRLRCSMMALVTLDRLYDRMTSRLGPLAVVRSKPVNTHIPELAVKLEPVDCTPTPSVDGARERRRHGLCGCLPQPEPIMVDRRGARCTARQHDLAARYLSVRQSPRARADRRRMASGRAAKLMLTARDRRPAAQHPDNVERYFEEGEISRDYYIAEDDGGRRFWLFRLGLFRHRPRTALVSARVLRMSSIDDGYVELVSTSNFSFLRGGSHPEELAVAAGALGLDGFGLTDRNSFAGVVRAYVALRDMEPRPA